MSSLLSAPEYSLSELRKHKGIICMKAKISPDDFEKRFSELKRTVSFVSLSEYRDFIGTALKISPDPDDADFFALALSTGSPLWSNDSAWKRQDKIDVFTTSDLLFVL
jgi:predicted nucleic acid-binding protein